MSEISILKTKAGSWSNVLPTHETNYEFLSILECCFLQLARYLNFL